MIYDSKLLKAWIFVTIMLVAINLSALAAHVMELSPKMSFDSELYVMLHRTLYPNFGLIAGSAEGLALLSIIGLAWRLRHWRAMFPLMLASAILLVLSHVLFWIFVYPANTTMAAWPMDEIPADWTRWRDQWEYAHAARAALTFVALGLLVGTLLLRHSSVRQRDRGVAASPQPAD